MSDRLTILTWLWRQTPDRHGYFKDGGGADKVNVWASMLRLNCGLDIDVACVTDCPEGIDESIRIIPLPKIDETQGIIVKQWSEKAGAPQCYRRLTMYREDAAEIFGAERFVSMDLDVVIQSPVDSLFDHDCDFVMFKGTSGKRPYNGSMQMIRAGSRSAVWEDFAKDPQGLALAARRKYIGSDQAIISLVLGKGEATWGVADGVEAYGGGFMRRYGRQHRNMRVPDNVKIVFFPGPTKPWQLLDRVSFINQHWHTGTPRGRAVGSGFVGGASITRTTAARQPAFFALDDPGKWGRRFKIQADELTRLPTRLFIREQRVPQGSRVFARIDRTSKYGQPARQIIATLHKRKCITLPTIRDARVAFDLSVRRQVLGPVLATDSTLAPALSVFVVGTYLFGQWPDGRSLKLKSSRGKMAAKLAASVAKTRSLQWIRLDIVFEHEKPRILDIGLTWDDKACDRCPMFDLSLKPVKETASDSFRVAVDILSALKYVEDVPAQIESQPVVAG
jgi:hypothetical protein